MTSSAGRARNRFDPAARRWIKERAFLMTSLRQHNVDGCNLAPGEEFVVRSERLAVQLVASGHAIEYRSRDDSPLGLFLRGLGPLPDATKRETAARRSTKPRRPRVVDRRR
jgi:hypothetical protein